MTRTEKAWSEDMGRLSRVCGGSESVCRAMVMAGIRWIDDHPEADPQFRKRQGEDFDATVVPEADNEDAKALNQAMMDASGARRWTFPEMHKAAIEQVLLYKKVGWDKYCLERRVEAETKRRHDRGVATMTQRQLFWTIVWAYIVGILLLAAMAFLLSLALEGMGLGGLGW